MEAVDVACGGERKCDGVEDGEEDYGDERTESGLW